jgi:hypothetical protein
MDGLDGESLIPEGFFAEDPLHNIAESVLVVAVVNPKLLLL